MSLFLNWLARPGPGPGLLIPDLPVTQPGTWGWYSHTRVTFRQVHPHPRNAEASSRVLVRCPDWVSGTLGGIWSLITLTARLCPHSHTHLGNCKQQFGILTDLTRSVMLPFFLFWSAPCLACEILVPQAGIEPLPPAVEAQSPHSWPAREVSCYAPVWSIPRWPRGRIREIQQWRWLA